LAATVIMRRTVVASPGVSVGDGPRLVRDIRATMRKTGWKCIDVDADQTSPAYSYTIGMGAKKRPDLLLVWDAERAARASLLNAVAEVLTKRRGRIPPHFEPLGPGRVRLNRVYDNEFFEKCPLASVWNAMHGIKGGTGLQIVFPDENGYYPD
jgi:hypothetical protein